MGAINAAPSPLSITGGGPPLSADFASWIAAAPDLADRLVNEFAPVATTLTTQQAYWIGLNGWITDRLSGPIMNGEVTVDELGAQTWAVYASSYWGGLELREHWGMPPAMERIGMQLPQHPFIEVQQGMVGLLRQRLEAVHGGGAACLQALPAILRDASPNGPIHGSGYNAGVQVVKTEDPPIGQRRPHRTPRPAAVRINSRAFMRVDYDMPTPQYLKESRSAFERAVTSHPEEYERIIRGEHGETNLRDVWKTAVEYGNLTWGGDAQDGWTDAYWEESIRWSSTVNFGLEAAGQAAFVALLTGDEDAALRAVMCNVIYLGASPGWLLGLLDVEATLPTVG
ncbi:MAG: hypothetical protein Q7V88_15850 [Actinomycetota bacterium]|nr:hypothetical protein [Actinomycetota bacterium]